MYITVPRSTVLLFYYVLIGPSLCMIRLRVAVDLASCRYRPTDMYEQYSCKQQPGILHGTVPQYLGTADCGKYEPRASLTGPTEAAIGRFSSIDLVLDCVGEVNLRGDS